MLKKIALASIPLLLTGIVTGTVVTATADPSTGTVSIVRTVRGDSSATPVAGIPLNIYSGTNTSAQPIKRVVSTNKALQFTLPQGQYTIVEPGAARYTAGADKGKIPLTFTVSPSAPANVVYAGPTAVTLQPQGDNGAPVRSGGQYRVTTCNDAPITVLTPNGSDQSLTTVAPKGCIKVATITAPKGMGKKAPVTVQTVSNGPTRVPVALSGVPKGKIAPQPIKGKASVTLTSQVRGSSTPLPRATYNFIDCSTGAVKARATTGDNGKTTFTLPHGCYRVKQHKAVAGYDMDATEQEFTLTSGHAIITVSNRKTGDASQPVSAVPVVAMSDEVVAASAHVVGSGSGAPGAVDVASIPAGRTPSVAVKCVIPEL